MPHHLEGKTAIVTGGGRGIGRGIALALAAQGAKVIVNDYGATVEGQGTDNMPASQVVEEIRKAGGTAEPNFADVSDHRAAEDLVRQAINTWGHLDILVNVAGILRERMIFNMTEEEWDAVIRVHLKGTYNTTHFASIHWRSDRRGGYRLINFTSTAGINGSAGQPNYAAAKAGLIGFTKSCANALARYGVTSNAIAPGAATRMTDRGLANQDATRSGAAPSARAGGSERDPENVAPIVVYLCSGEAENVSGRVIAASGYRIGLYSDMQMEREIFNDGPWDVDRLFELAPNTLFKGLTPPDGNRPMSASA
ncbi:MAG: SDR family NAD(P)-dependent oxidoreductase [Chloroflexi bacterium]|nr:SDR family NAD(P)-dependent oxidoreductase [Chloroflexota bacterium]MDA1239688.1 SDR family NAD(P)-dependent oxidoreductase [Chloroflexota bacterium]